jgi:hypothetical protein
MLAARGGEDGADDRAERVVLVAAGTGARINAGAGVAQHVKDADQRDGEEDPPAPSLGLWLQQPPASKEVRV